MRVISISGTFGSGKTTVIKALSHRLHSMGKRIAVIANENGKTPYDKEFTELLDIPVKHLRGGWMGCTLATSLVTLKKKIKRSINPDYLFLEPSEMIVTTELRQVLSMGLRDIQYSVGPFISLIDSPSFSFNWEERKKLIQGQIQETDQIALGRVDMIEKNEINHICESLQVRKSGLVLLSLQDNKGLDSLQHRILSMD